MGLRAIVVVLSSTALVPRPHSIHDPERTALAVELVPFELEPPAHAPFLGKRNDAVSPARPNDKQRADLYERCSAYNGKPPGSGDLMIDARIGASWLGEIEPSARAERNEPNDVSSLEGHVVVAHDEPLAERPGSSQELVNERELRSVTRADRDMGEVVGDVVERPPGDAQPATSAGSTRRRTRAALRDL